MASYHLPDDVHHLILQRLAANPVDLVSSFFVSKKWSTFRYSNDIWRSAFTYAMGRANVEEAERAFTDSVLLFQKNINNYLQRLAEQKQVVSTYNSKTNQWESNEVKNENILDLERRGPFSNRVFSALDPFQRFMLLRTLGTLKVDLYISSETDKSAQMRGKYVLFDHNIRNFPPEDRLLIAELRSFSDLDSESRKIYRGRGFHLDECDNITKGTCLTTIASLLRDTEKKAWSPYSSWDSKDEISIRKVYRCGTGMKSFTTELAPGEKICFQLPLRIVDWKHFETVESHLRTLDCSGYSKVQQAVKTPQKHWLAFGDFAYLAFPETGPLEFLSVHEIDDGQSVRWMMGSRNYSAKLWDCSLPLSIEYESI